MSNFGVTIVFTNLDTGAVTEVGNWITMGPREADSPELQAIIAEMVHNDLMTEEMEEMFCEHR